MRAVDRAIEEGASLLLVVVVGGGGMVQRLVSGA